MAIDPDTKLVPAWWVGDRTQETGKLFLEDLYSRLAARVQLMALVGWHDARAGGGRRGQALGCRRPRGHAERILEATPPSHLQAAQALTVKAHQRTPQFELGHYPLPYLLDSCARPLLLY